MSNEHPHNGGDHTGHDHGGAPKNIPLNPDAKGDIETTLRVTGMDCADEVEALEQVFRPLKGVREVRVNLMGGKVTLFHDESVTPEQLIGAVASTGMKAARDGDDAELTWRARSGCGRFPSPCRARSPASACSRSG